MTKNQPVEIIKGALLLERRGQAFYKAVATQTQSEAVKNFFQLMADEEDQHVTILTRQYTSLVQEGKLQEIRCDARPQEFAGQILNEQIRKEITAACYEASAISAAIGLEDRAVNFYSTEAAKAETPIEKELYFWLANWEKSHLKMLLEIDDALRQDIWNDNNFWPQ